MKLKKAILVLVAACAVLNAVTLLADEAFDYGRDCYDGHAGSSTCQCEIIGAAWDDCSFNCNVYWYPNQESCLDGVDYAYDEHLNGYCGGSCF